MADNFYFSHDYGARNDPKLVTLQMELGHKGKGIFWDLIEICYEQGGYILFSELKSIAFALHTEYESITSVLNSYGLFENDGNAYWSKSVLNRLEARGEKSEKARQNVLKRWDKYKSNTGVLQTNNEGNTIKERKESKEEEKKEKYLSQFEIFWNLYNDKTDRKKCLAKWMKLTEHEIETILATVTDFKQYKKFATYTHPNPLTYLNGKRWEDVLPNVKKIEQKEIIQRHFMGYSEYLEACEKAGIAPKQDDGLYNKF